MYAIRNKKTGKWLYGTDYRYYPFHQRTSYEKALTFEDKWDAEMTLKARRCNKNYEVVKVELKEQK